MKGIVALEDGTRFFGEGFGAAGLSMGEVVFCTGLTGYQEVLTDPSYCNQIVTMTYPLIGNYGVNETDVESAGVQVAGFIVKEYCPFPSNFASQKSLAQYLQESNIIAVAGIDTRALTRHLRIAGAMKGAIFCGNSEPADLIEKIKAWPGLVGADLAKVVSCTKSYPWLPAPQPDSSRRYKVVAYDFGIKFNIARMLSRLGCDLTIVPANTTAAEVLALKPDGVFLSNGPGDPAAVGYAIESIRQLLGKVPLFGICLGHQLIGLALGAKTYKLKFGHRGLNHPVKNLLTGAVEITTQNHGFCVDIDSLTQTGATLTHLNLNDQTCEGLEHEEKRVFSVQYHPEAAPGPDDSAYLFEKFLSMMKAQ